ncbi:MAG: hypothetical protein HPY58_11115 [Firmicutes bacterium]|nr:hypothetical protein [Bacillota bacterium]
MPDAARDLLSTAEVCRILGVTPREVRRLAAEGYLEIKRVDRCKHGILPFFSERQVEAVRRQLPRILRQWEGREGAERGAAAAWKRLREWRSCHQTKLRKERFLKALEELPEKSGLLLRAAYYLYHLNHYAKAGESYLYDLKEKVLACMAAHFAPEDGLRLYFIPGPARIRLCPACRRRARSQKKTYLEYCRLTGGCPCCRRDEDYYSLYEFLIESEEHRFCFHTPAQLGRKWLKGMEIPEKEGSEREGGYPFGRPIFPGEAAAVNLAEVIEELEKFLKNFT